MSAPRANIGGRWGKEGSYTDSYELYLNIHNRDYIQYLHMSNPSIDLRRNKVTLYCVQTKGESKISKKGKKSIFVISVHQNLLLFLLETDLKKGYLLTGHNFISHGTDR